jgi:prepilin-type processing-associated H-X9-DG protein
MKPSHAKFSKPQRGFTITEALVILVVLVLLAGFVFPRPDGAKYKRGRINCVNNLKQVGLAYRMWSHDNQERFPWSVAPSPTNTGTLLFATSTNVWRHFQAISNEVNTPKVFVCPEDKQRTRVAGWDAFTNNSHLSYFLGMDADETKPQTILTGDRNVSISNSMLTGFVRLSTNTVLGWTKAIHQGQGNVGLADGSAMQMTESLLNKQYQAASMSLTQSVLQFSFPQ